MNNTTIIWLVPLFCVLGSLLSSLLFIAAIVNTARLERRHEQRAPAHRPYQPQAAPGPDLPSPIPNLQPALPKPTHAHH